MNRLGPDRPIKHFNCGRKPQLTTASLYYTTLKIKAGAAFLPMQRPYTKKLRGIDEIPLPLYFDDVDSLDEWRGLSV